MKTTARPIANMNGLGHLRHLLAAAERLGRVAGRHVEVLDAPSRAAATIADSLKPGRDVHRDRDRALAALARDLRGRRCRRRRLMTSASGTWPSVRDGTAISASAIGSLRNRSAARRNTGYWSPRSSNVDASTPPTSTRERRRDVRRVDAEHRRAVEVGLDAWSRRPDRARLESRSTTPGTLLHRRRACCLP